MDDEGGIDEERGIRAQLDLHLEPHPVRGRLRTEQGDDEQFVGWIGFVEAMKRLGEVQEPGPPTERKAKQ
jgi:hypothetical protein